MSSANLGYFELTMIPNKRQEKENRIPIRFVDDEAVPASEANASDTEVDNDASIPVGDGDANSVDSDLTQQPNVKDETDHSGDEESSDVADMDDAGPSALDDAVAKLRVANELNPPEASSMSSEGGPPPADNKTTAGPMLAELLATRAELRRVETERNDLLERLARRQADFENFRKRVERERGESFHRMVGDVVGKLLPVMDNMRRALEAESLMEKNESAEFRHFLRGVELIYKQLNDALEELGVEAVPAVGQPFDPHVHEAVATEHSEEYEPDIVTQELLRGYRLGEKLLRPAMVKVSTKQ